jgi:spermidine synthase
LTGSTIFCSHGFFLLLLLCFSYFETKTKKQIASVKIGSERVDIYDVLRPKFQSFDSYKASLRKEDGSYESRNPTFFQPDRIVYVNGVLQTRRSGDASYHESLVHPAMFAHEYPARVAIIGGADGAILREVLKHKTVKKVVMIEDDERLLNLTNEHFPEYTDCSFLTGGTKSCLDDPRVEIYYEDVHEYFGDEESDHTTTEPFDVIIMDEV